MSTTTEPVAAVDARTLPYRRRLLFVAALTLAVVHGYFEHSGRYRALAEAMAGLGVATYAVDLRGHGLSDGARGHVDPRKASSDAS